MSTLPVDIYSVATVREIDRTAIEDENIPGYALMKRFTGLMSQRLHAARMKMMDSWAPPGWA